MDNNSEELNEGYRDASNMLMVLGILVLLFRGILAWMISSLHAWSLWNVILAFSILTVGAVVVAVVVDIALNRTSRGKRRIIVGCWAIFLDVVFLGMELAEPTKEGFFVGKSEGPALWFFTGASWAPFLWTLGGSLLLIISGVVRLKGWRKKK